MPAIELSGVTKRYGEFTALQNLDMRVKSGEIFGFLGPNGAGKSTTIDILVDQVRPTSGEVTVLGEPVQERPVAVRQRAGLLPEQFGPLGEMTGREHLAFALEARGVDDDAESLLERVGIAHASDRPARAYSKGMKQRLMLGIALAGAPELLILDEPTTGLDPNGAREIRQIVREEAERGATVFFSSHILEQVEAVCDRVGILHHGQLVAVDTIEGLREAVDVTGELTITLDSTANSISDAVAAIDGVGTTAIDENRLTVGCTNRAKAKVISTCLDAGHSVLDIETQPASLEDLFAAYTRGETDA